MKNLKAVFTLAIALFIFAGCKKDKDPVAPATPKPTAEFYFTAKIDGADHLLQALVDGYGSGAGAGAGNTSGLWAQEQSLMLVNMNTQLGSGVIFMKNFIDEPEECSQMEEMVKMGTHPYGKTDKLGAQAVNGVVVVYTDVNGKYWASDLGTGDQSGSSFEVVEHIANNDGFSQRITKAKFNCKLYDGQGNSKVLTNGEIRSRSVQCNHL